MINEILNIFYTFISVQADTFNAVGIFDNIYYLLMDGFLTPLSQEFNAVIAFIGPIFKFTWFLFILTYGYLILSGKIQAPAKEFVFRMAIITAVFWFTLSPTIFRKIIIEPTIVTTHTVTNVLTPNYSSGSIFSMIGNKLDKKREGATNESLYVVNRDLFAALDVSLESVGIIISSVIATYQSTLEVSDAISEGKGGTEGSASGKVGDTPFLNVMLVMGFIGLLITGSVMVYVTAAIILMLNHLLLVILLVIGPIFLAFSVFKSTREYSKKWLTRLAAVILTIGITSAVIAFILAIQGDVSKQICKTTISLQNEMVIRYNDKVKAINAQNLNSNPIPIKQLTEVEDSVRTALEQLHNRTQHIGSLGNYFKVQELASQIKLGCLEGAQETGNSNSAETRGYNILFAAIQFLVICMVLNRVLTESSNIAATLFNASGINAGTGHEVSGGMQGISGRVSQSPTGKMK